jgi:hypothetical protein
MLEAYDAYVTALQEEPKNGVASSGVARLLLEIVNQGLGPRELTNLAARYLHHAGASKAEIVELAGPHALKRINELSATVLGQHPASRREPLGFAGFVYRRRRWHCSRQRMPDAPSGGGRHAATSARRIRNQAGNGAVFKRLGFLASREPGNEVLAEACAKRLTAGNAKLDPALACPRGSSRSGVSGCLTAGSGEGRHDRPARDSRCRPRP